MWRVEPCGCGWAADRDDNSCSNYDGTSSELRVRYLITNSIYRAELCSVSQIVKRLQTPDINLPGFGHQSQISSDNTGTKLNIQGHQSNCSKCVSPSSLPNNLTLIKCRHHTVTMGNEQSLEQNQSVRIANFTEFPLVYVISQLGPLYWGVIQPGERVTRCTGRFWFTIDCFAYDGTNEPETKNAVVQTLVPALGILGVLVSGGWAFMGAAAAAAPTVGTAQAAFVPLLPVCEAPLAVGALAGGKAAASAFAVAETANKLLVSKDCLERGLKAAQKKGHYANGDWLHVRGGPQKGVDPAEWQGLRFET